MNIKKSSETENDCMLQLNQDLSENIFLCQKYSCLTLFWLQEFGFFLSFIHQVSEFQKQQIMGIKEHILQCQCPWFWVIALYIWGLYYWWIENLYSSYLCLKSWDSKQHWNTGKAVHIYTLPSSKSRINIIKPEIQLSDWK